MDFWLEGLQVHLNICKMLIDLILKINIFLKMITY